MRHLKITSIIFILALVNFACARKPVEQKKPETTTTTQQGNGDQTTSPSTKTGDSLEPSNPTTPNTINNVSKISIQKNGQAIPILWDGKADLNLDSTLQFR